MSETSSFITIAAISSALGIKGWLKVSSFTDPADNILGYEQFFVGKDGQWKLVECEAAREHGKAFAIKLKGCDDRNQAELYRHYQIAVKESDLPKLDADEFYWHQLQGLQVFVDATGQLLGCVSHLLETGSNDVLVVKACEGSIDKRERLLPYRPEVVLSIDLVQGRMTVDWDADF